jgi:GDP-mannose transporter
MAPVTILFCLMLWTSGKALRYCSMPLFTVCKNLAVVGTTTYEYFRFGAAVSIGIVISLALMTTGSVIAGYGDMSATPVGILWLLANVLVTISYLAVLKERMPPDVSSATKTLHNNMLTLVIFLISSGFGGELVPFCEQIAAQTTTFQLGVLMTGVLGTAINMTTFWCMHVTSGATYAFVGASNKIPVALLGHFLFHSVITPTGWSGVTLGLGSGLVYAITKERERQLREAEARKDGESQRLLSAENGDASDAEAGDSSDEDGRSSQPALTLSSAGR